MKVQKHRLSAMLAAVMLPAAMLFSLLSLTAAGEGGKTYLYFEKYGTLTLKESSGEAFVSLLGAALYLDGGGRYDGKTGTMTVTVGEKEISAAAGESAVFCGGARFAGGQNFLSDGKLYIPVASLASALGRAVEKKGNILYLTERTAAGRQEEPDPDCVLWLARIIYCESRGQPYEGQLAVGSVVMNRVASPDYPDTIFSVIFDRKYGVQFTPAGNGAVWCTPDKTALKAAEQVLRGYRTDGRILYFMNEALAASSWISDNRAFAFRIGDHSFYY